MSLPLPHFAGLALILALAGPGPATAAETFDTCTGFITSVPAVISTQGTWCMDRDLATGIGSGYAIIVSANNVTLDCNGFKLGGLAAGSGTTATGIGVTSRLNFTLRRCNVRGFHYGLAISGAPSAGHLVEDNLFDGNTYIGLQANGAGTMIRRNRVNDTGGSSVTVGFAMGIYALGSLDVMDNTIYGVVPTPDGEGNGEAEGIRIASSQGAGVSGNRVRGVLAFGVSPSRFINTLFSERSDVRGNFLVGPGANGIACGLNDVAEGNHVTGFTTALNNCAAYPNFVVN